MMDHAMSERRFKELIAAYGADAGRWPALERAAAQELLRTRPDLADLRSDEAELDTVLADWRAPEIPASLSQRILDSFPTRLPQMEEFSVTRFLRLLFGGREGAPAFAMASIVLLLALGGLGGMLGSSAYYHDPGDTVILSQAFGSNDGFDLSSLETSS